MRNIEKKLTSYVENHGPRPTDNYILKEANKDNEVVDALFHIINKELEKITGEESLEKVRQLIRYIQIIFENCDNIDRRYIKRKLTRLDEKIDRIKLENRKKFVNINNAYKELKTTQDIIDKIEDKVDKEEQKPYEFVSYLIEEIKDINYIDSIFEKMPSLINVKDINGDTLFHTVMEKYKNSILQNQQDKIAYYKSIISLFLSKKKFTMSQQEKKICLEDIYKIIDRISVGKKNAKKNKESIEWLKRVVEGIKEVREKHPSIESIATKYNIDVFFDEDIIKQAKLVKTPMEGNMVDRKVIDEYIITIDKANVKEIDDALSCRKLENGNYLLGVHIASILGYFPYESDIVQEAISRNRSIYLSKKYLTQENELQRTIPIFPFDFSTDKASLLENKRRLTRSYLFEIDSRGNVVNQDFSKSIITVNKNMIYQEVNEIIEQGVENKELQRTIQALKEVTNILNRKYHTIDLYEQIKESTDDFSDLRVKQVGAERIVYKAMVLTGNKVAEYFAHSKEQYPCLYRVHKINEDNARKIQAMIEHLKETYGGENFQKLYQLIEGIYPKGWYEMAGAHDGLGLKHYCHCTSGIRRAADIIVEHALEVCYDKKPTEEEVRLLREDIKRKALEINAKQDPIKWFVNDYKKTYQKKR